MSRFLLNIAICSFFAFMTSTGSVISTDTVVPSLYTDKVAGIRVVDWSNSTEFLRDHVAIVQYYLATCGHCQDYAPIFLAGNQIYQNLQDFYTPVVINCNVMKNVDICQSVKHYPSLICNNPGSSNSSFEIFPSRENAESYVDTIYQCLKTMPHVVDAVLQPNATAPFSLLGKDKDLLFKIMLRFYGTGKLDPQIDQSLLENELSLKQGQNLILSKVSEEEIEGRFALKQHNGILQDYSLKPDPQFKPTIGVHAADIISSLYDLFNIDVPLKKTLTGDTKAALIEFLLLLKELSPFNDQYNRAIEELAAFLQSQEVVTSEQWNRALEQTAYPTLRPGFVACKGSAPKFRGYPCGLWTLFHSLTAIEHLKFPGRSPKVPHAMNRLIVFIFSCTECSVHFATATSNVLNLGESVYPKDTRREDLMSVSSTEKTNLPSVPHTSGEAVLWLNKVHNRVNMRLKGAKSEDPMVPKVIFPPFSFCSMCYCKSEPNSTTPCKTGQPDQWNNLLSFLVDYYSPCNWNLDLIGSDVVFFNCEEQKESSLWMIYWMIPTAMLFTFLCVALFVLCLKGMHKPFMPLKNRI